MTTTKRCLLHSIALIAISTAITTGSPASALAFPDKPLTMIVPFTAGGGTDATGRMLATLMEKSLGQPINVVNRPGGNGLVGHSAIANASPDGYTIGIATTESTSYKPIGLSDFQPTTAYTHVGIYNRDSTSILVAQDSRFKTVGALIEAIKAGEKVRVSTGGAFGGSYQIAFGLLLKDRGVDPMTPTYVSSQGSAPGLQELVSGGVDVTVTTLPEAASLLQAKRVKALAVIGDTPSPTYPDVPTTAAALGAAEMTFASWRGVMGPAGMPQEVVDKLREVIAQSVQSDEFQKFMANRGFGTAWVTGNEASTFIEASASDMASGLKEIGLAK